MTNRDINVLSNNIESALKSASCGMYISAVERIDYILPMLREAAERQRKHEEKINQKAERKNHV